MDKLSKSRIKSVKALGTSKGRRESDCFKVEGTKLVLDTIGHFDVVTVVATAAWYDANRGRLHAGIELCQATREDLERMTSLSTAPDVIAVYRIPLVQFDPSATRTNLVLALDTIQDPGNLGTIVRIADWFGIRHIVCSRETVDIYNPKTIQSTMGALSRVAVTYHDLADLLGQLRADGVDVCGTFLGGDDIFDESTPLPSTGVIVIGNEGNGISDKIADLVTRRLTIPSYPPGEPTGESLNAAVATAITVSTFRQRELKWQRK
ncbi:MAG: RNA methyltransferase [Muribaculaceae bacterium]|nr:RNA methyltransferase [Muribaculaceae bacterium]